MTKTAMPEAMSSAPSTAPLQRRHRRCPGRDGTLHPQGEGQREREPSLPGPPRCRGQGVGIRAVTSPLTPELSAALHSQRSFPQLLPVWTQARDAFAETGNNVFYTDTVPTLGFLSFYC